MSLASQNSFNWDPSRSPSGVLPYPITFLCTDLVSELYGKKRANFLVTVGLFINGFILLVMTTGQYVASVDPSNMPPWQVLQLAAPVALPQGWQP
jgi:uncharacterized PurR-regulated membrane protein YhhQ (DUF165 family)